MSPSTTKKIILITLTAALLVPLFLFRVRKDMVDFSVNYRAGLRLRYGESLYRTEDEHYQFKYLPSSAVLYAPLSQLPLDGAKAVWFCLVVFCLAALVLHSYRLSFREGDGQRSLMLLTPLILTKFILREIQLGQINALLALLLVLMIRALSDTDSGTSRSGDYKAGVFWGLAVALKPYAFLFLPYLLIKGRWKSLAAGAVTIILTVLSPIFYFGWEGNWTVHREWAETLSLSTPALLTSQDNISIISMFMKWTGDRQFSLIGAGVLVSFLILSVLILIRKGKITPNSTVLEGAFLLICIPLVSPLGWDYTLLVSMPGLMIILHNWKVYTRLWRFVLVLNLMVVALSLYDLLGKELYARFMSWSVITFNFLLILVYLIFIRMKRVE